MKEQNNDEETANGIKRLNRSGNTTYKAYNPPNKMRGMQREKEKIMTRQMEEESKGSVSEANDLPSL